MTSIRSIDCPCGSGRKYVECCLSGGRAAKTTQGRCAHVRHAAKNRLNDHLLGWCKFRLGPDWADRAIDRISLIDPPEPDEFSLIVPWLLHQRPFNGSPPAKRFVRDHGAELASTDREVLRCCMEAWLSIWEIRNTKRGVGIHFFDVLAEQSRFVHDVKFSHRAMPGMAVLAMLIIFPEVTTFGGSHPMILKPFDWEDVVVRVRNHLGIPSGAVPVARLKAASAQVALIREWRMVHLQHEMTRSLWNG